jgi:hypothetical protein
LASAVSTEMSVMAVDAMAIGAIETAVTPIAQTSLFNVCLMVVLINPLFVAIDESLVGPLIKFL